MKEWNRRKERKRVICEKGRKSEKENRKRYSCNRLRSERRERKREKKAVNSEKEKENREQTSSRNWLVTLFVVPINIKVACIQQLIIHFFITHLPGLGGKDGRKKEQN